MRLIRWNPKQNLISLPGEMEPFFNNFGQDFWNTDSVWNPAVDISESDSSFLVNAEIPGMTKNDIKISIEDDVLTLSGEKKLEKKEDKKNYHRAERLHGKFERSFHIPREVKIDQIKADYENGILSVNIPKSEKIKPKEIAIN